MSADSKELKTSKTTQEKQHFELQVELKSR